MGTTREWGYREYDDDLTPGKDGESSLLFDDDGRLVAHAPFFKADQEADEGLGGIETISTDTEESDDSEIYVLVAAGVALAAAAAIGGGVTFWRYLQSKRRAKLVETAQDPDRTADAQEELSALLGIDFAAQDDLIDDIDVLMEVAPNRPTTERLGNIIVNPVDDEAHECSQPERRSNNA